MSQQPPLRLPLIASFENRDSTSDADAKLVNGYVEKSAMGDLWCRKRPAYSLASAVGTPTKRAAGVYDWEGDFYSIFGNEFYQGSTLIGAVDGTSSRGYWFSQTLAATPQLFFHNINTAYTYDSGAGLVEVADVNYPVETVPGVAYLDGTTYVMTPDCYILGSGINNPQSWDPLNSIRAQIEPSNGIAIAKQLSFVVVFKEYTTEVFYNAQNPAGSPLGRVEGAQFNYGCHQGNTVIDIDGVLYWLGRSKTGGVNVMRMEGLKPEVVSTPAIERLLEAYNYLESGTYATRLYAGGHRFYLLTNMTENITLVYDTGEKLWFQWTDTAGNFFPILFAARKQNSSIVLGQSATTGDLYIVSADLNADVVGEFTFDLYTPNWDGGSRMRKMVNLLEVSADRKSSGVLQVRFSDDDYQNWSSFREIDLSGERPFLDQMGTFKERAHHFRHRGNQSLRLRSVDLHVDLGAL